MSMYKFGILASYDKETNKKNLKFLESCGYSIEGLLGDAIYPFAYAITENRVCCAKGSECEIAVCTIEEARKFLTPECINININIPEGYEIDRENSTFECIKFKKKQLTYEDIAKKLFKDKDCFFADATGEMHCISNLGIGYTQSNNCTSKNKLKNY